MNKNIVKHDYFVSRKDRHWLNGHRSLLLWFTGFSGSGKSTIASCLEQVLFERNIHTYSLDGDNIRTGLNKGLDFSPEDRHENIRRVAEVGKLFVDAGLVTLTAFISPLHRDRELAREIIGAENFVEVFINTSLSICEERDVKGLYKKARAGEITDFTGIDAPYEAPIDPEIEINTAEESLEESVQRLVRYLEDKLKLE